MTANEFIIKWQTAINYLGLRSVGINVRWDKISLNSVVNQFSGKNAWNKLYTFTPPWFKTPKTFQYLIDNKDSDYQQIVTEETSNGKIEYYRKNGLMEPFFCAFANKDGSFVLLGDGNHRFLDCLHLIHEKNVNLKSDIDRSTLDIIYLDNFNFVTEPVNIWGSSI